MAAESAIQRPEIQPTQTVIVYTDWDLRPMTLFKMDSLHVQSGRITYRYSNLILFISFVLNVLFGVR